MSVIVLPEAPEGQEWFTVAIPLPKGQVFDDLIQSEVCNLLVDAGRAGLAAHNEKVTEEATT